MNFQLIFTLEIHLWQYEEVPAYHAMNILKKASKKRETVQNIIFFFARRFLLASCYAGHDF